MANLEGGRKPLTRKDLSEQDWDHLSKKMSLQKGRVQAANNAAINATKGRSDTANARREQLRAAGEHIKDVDTSLEAEVAHRVGLVERQMHRSRIKNRRTGGLFYEDSADVVAAIGEEFDLNPVSVATATARASVMNTPKEERKATYGAAAWATEGRTGIQKKKNKETGEMEEIVIPLGQNSMTTGEKAYQGVVRAATQGEPINGLTAPKIGSYGSLISARLPERPRLSYDEATEQADSQDRKLDMHIDYSEPNPIRLEAKTRLRRLDDVMSGQLNPNQLQLDFTGLGDSITGPFDPYASIPADMYENAITTMQPHTVAIGGKFPASILSEHIDPKKKWAHGEGGEHRGHVVMGDYAGASTAAIKNAYTTEAVNQSNLVLAKKYGMTTVDEHGQEHSLISSGMGQALGWAGVRDEANADPDVRAANRQWDEESIHDIAAAGAAAKMVERQAPVRRMMSRSSDIRALERQPRLPLDFG